MATGTQDTSTLPEWISFRQAAAQLKVHRTLIPELVKRGVLSKWRPAAGRPKVLRGEVEELARSAYRPRRGPIPATGREGDPLEEGG
jgi:hypothetical protein